jgi:hypothetical protein
MGIVNGKAMKFFVRGSSARDSIVYDDEALSLEADLWLQNGGSKYLLLGHANVISPDTKGVPEVIQESAASMNK